MSNKDTELKLKNCPFCDREKPEIVVRSFGDDKDPRGNGSQIEMSIHFLRKVSALISKLEADKAELRKVVEKGCYNAHRRPKQCPISDKTKLAQQAETIRKQGEENKQLLEKLEKYGNHYSWCATKKIGQTKYVCNCGFRGKKE